MTAVATGLHHPVRPGWDCALCGLPYPCPPTRDRLVAYYGLSTQLGLRAWVMLHQMAADRPDLPGAVLFVRCVAWTEPVRMR